MLVVELTPKVRGLQALRSARADGSLVSRMYHDLRASGHSRRGDTQSDVYAVVYATDLRLYRIGSPSPSALTCMRLRVYR
ncbi:hypothetical protein R1flu_019004 [Riccia fluitans]|uniref:Uncharacterized protein n=1 Tax=Riccia fluitans TaxID=41844 RepID=A0ABD1ZIZ6_9MARC